MNPLHAAEALMPSFIRRRLSRVRSRIEKIIRQPTQSVNSQRGGTAASRVDSSRPKSQRPASLSTKHEKAPGRKATRGSVTGEPSERAFFTAAELSEYLDITTATVSNWRRGYKVYGYRLSERSYAYPKEQIIQGGNKRKPRVIDGLEAVLRQFDDPGTAWAWLTERSTEVGTKSRPQTRPIDELRRGRRNVVCAAAKRQSPSST